MLWSKDLIIGTKYSGHDSGVFILDVKNKKVLASNVERYTRVKHDDYQALGLLIYLMKKEGIKPKEITLIHPFLSLPNRKLHRKVLKKYFNIRFRKDIIKLTKNRKHIRLLFKKNPIAFLQYAYYILENEIVGGVKVKNPLFKPLKRFLLNYITKQLRKELKLNLKVTFKNKDHHTCHAASAYYFSPYKKNEKVLVITADGYGDGYWTKIFVGENSKLNFIIGSETEYLNREMECTSLGTIYSRFTAALDLIPGSDEGKVEALAAYSKKPRETFLYHELKKQVRLDPERLKIYIDRNKAKHLFDVKWLKNARKKVGDEEFAGAIQRFTEDFLLDYVKAAIKKTGIKKIALAGGLFANVITNMRIFEESGAEQIYIFPAMGDAGTAAGAAALEAVERGYDISWLKELEMPYWGPSYTREDVEKSLEKWKNKINFQYIGERWYKQAAKEIADGKIISIFQGRMEFGPRALGNRSVLADPRKKETRDRLNSTIKRRPWYQPFCPSVLDEERKRLFKKAYCNKHMTCAFRVKDQYINKIPSAMHIDGTSRAQFVTERDNPNYYKLIKEFKKLTGYGIVVNTSFNLHGRAIVMTPDHAIEDFIDCGIDAMYIEGFRVTRR